MSAQPMQAADLPVPESYYKNMTCPELYHADHHRLKKGHVMLTAKQRFWNGISITINNAEIETLQPKNSSGTVIRARQQQIYEQKASLAAGHKQQHGADHDFPKYRVREHQRNRMEEDDQTRPDQHEQPGMQPAPQPCKSRLNEPIPYAAALR